MQSVKMPYFSLIVPCCNVEQTFFPGMLWQMVTYVMNKDVAHLFSHFVGSPKPWISWILSGMCFFDGAARIVEWEVSNGLRLLWLVPYFFRASHKVICCLLARTSEMKEKILRRVRRVLRGGR